MLLRAFVYDGHWDPHNLDPLPVSEQISTVEYRIAYIAYCIDNSKVGRDLSDKLQKITTSILKTCSSVLPGGSGEDRSIPMRYKLSLIDLSIKTRPSSNMKKPCTLKA
jgi:hypothetical protein